MAKTPDRPKKPKDPARPTRAKAARPDEAPTPDTLAELLNPGIARGTAGLGSGTNLQPPSDNSWDRRKDFSAAHTARKSPQGRDKPAATPAGVAEAPQADFTGSPITGLDPALAEELGLSDELKYRLPRADLPKPGQGLSSMGVAATAESLERLLREGRPEVNEQVWTPHRPPRPENS